MKFKSIKILFILSLLSFFNNNVYAADYNPRLFNVGFRIIDFKYQKGQEEKTLTLAAWYPTTDSPQSYVYSGQVEGRAAKDGNPDSANGPYPLLVFSHGYGGSGISSVFFTEKLAAKGWIVVAPDHNDKYSAVRVREGLRDDYDRRGFLRDAGKISSSGPQNREQYLYRLEEMKQSLDYILNADNLGKLIDREKIAVGGHSFGGYTALGMCGTIGEYYDKRIKGVLLFSTGAGGYLFDESELSKVKMPAMCLMGGREKNQKRADKTMAQLMEKVYENLASPKYFLVVKGANHFSFNNRFSERLLGEFLGGTQKQFEVIVKYSIAFLEKYVAAKPDVDDTLEKQDPLLERYIRQLN